MNIDKLDLFLCVYFHHIEKIINRNNTLDEIKFQSEEANTDEFQKKYFKSFVLENNNIDNTNIREFHLKMNGTTHKVDVEDLKHYKINNVFIPEELTEDFKKRIAETKRSVYTKPDLYLEITDGNTNYYQSLELKSTATNAIPGSSVQQIAPFEWVIFIKRRDKTAKITTGYYVNSITDRLPFPDRSPRPQVAFDTLSSWNAKNRRVINDLLYMEFDTNSIDEKIRILADWQSVLVDEWIEVINMERTRSSEKWFNNTIRKYTLEIIKKTSSMSPDELNKLTERLQRLIKD